MSLSYITRAPVQPSHLLFDPGTSTSIRCVGVRTVEAPNPAHSSSDRCGRFHLFCEAAPDTLMPADAPVMRPNARGHLVKHLEAGAAWPDELHHESRRSLAGFGYHLDVLYMARLCVAPDRLCVAELFSWSPFDGQFSVVYRQVESLDRVRDEMCPLSSVCHSLSLSLCKLAPARTRLNPFDAVSQVEPVALARAFGLGTGHAKPRLSVNVSAPLAF